MGKMRRITMALTLCLGCSWVVGCYYKAPTRRARYRSDYLGEAEAEGLIQKRLAVHGVKLISNMKLKREGVLFVADGYDRDMRVGYEYRSHEGSDFEDEEGQGEDGLSQAELDKLLERQPIFREFFLIVPEGTRDSVEQAIDEFIKNLYVWEVLKSKGVEKRDKLFPEEHKKKDLIPWESTGDLTKKREKMEEQEKLKKQLGQDEDPDEDWQDEGDEEDTKPKPDEGDDWKEPKPDKPKPSDKPDTTKPGKDPADDVWGEEDEDF